MRACTGMPRCVFKGKGEKGFEKWAGVCGGNWWSIRIRLQLGKAKSIF